MNTSQNISFEHIDHSDYAKLNEAVEIVTKQLTNMPYLYVQTLIHRKELNFHTILMTNSSSNDSIGCIVYRPFVQSSFAELSFICVLTKFQANGYGNCLMDVFISTLQQNDIRFAITYADNDAVTFFEKRGFEMGVEDIERNEWFHRIYHYDGGQIMSINIEQIATNKTYKAPNTNTALFEQCTPLKAFQCEYNIKNPPKIITDSKCTEYKLLKPSLGLTPSTNWKNTMLKKRKREKLNDTCPKRKKLKICDIRSEIINRERYKIVNIDEYAPNYSKYQTRYKKDRGYDRSLCIKLNYSHIDAIKHKLSVAEWDKITHFLEREWLKNTQVCDIIKAISKNWKLSKHRIVCIMDELNEKRESLYYTLHPKLRQHSIFIFAQKQQSIFWFDYEDECGLLHGYNLKQIASKTMNGDVNLFDCFYLDNEECTIKRAEDMLVCAKAFQIKKSNKMYLPRHILKELYIKNYPQFRYCFKSKNALFRKFIYSFSKR